MMLVRCSVLDFRVTCTPVSHARTFMSPLLYSNRRDFGGDFFACIWLGQRHALKTVRDALKQAF
jgi:hypothetical protein